MPGRLALAQNFPFSAPCYLKTGFLIASQNWEIVFMYIINFFTKRGSLKGRSSITMVVAVTSIIKIKYPFSDIDFYCFPKTNVG